MSSNYLCFLIFMAFLGLSCSTKEVTKMTISPGEKIKFMTLDPGHFHAGLVHKSMYPEVDSLLYIFAPDGPELKDHLARIQGYNSVLSLLQLGKSRAIPEQTIWNSCSLKNQEMCWW